MGLIPSLSTLLFALKVLVACYTIYLICLGIYNRYFHKLRHFPGPFWASITPLWYFRAVRYGRADAAHYGLHVKYGDFVRIAPNLIAICDAAAIDTIYGLKKGKVWRKGDFYDGFDPHIPGARTDGFSERDEARHAERRRIIASLYTQGNILKYEPCVDRVIELFYQRMEQFAESGETTDMSVWLKRYTFDVVGEIYYGRKGGFGMIRDDVDYNSWCLLMDVMPNVGAAVTYFPRYLKFFYFLSQVFSADGRAGLKGMFDVIAQAKRAVNERWQIMQSGGSYPEHDMLTGMLNIVRERGNKVNWTVADVQTEVWAVIWAGSDTTAIALTSIFYHLHKNHSKLAILLQEIDTAFEEGRLSYPIRLNDAIKLPYLHAVIMESMRIHGSLGTGFPREVPSEGATVCGTFIPGTDFTGGTEVIMNQCAVHFDRRAFGDDADRWIPERWIRSGPEVAGKMERSMLHFGHGPRVCIGRYITNTEMYKLLPTVLRDFEFELLVSEWKVWKGWFHNARDVNVRVRRRRTGFERPRLVTEEMR